MVLKRKIERSIFLSQNYYLAIFEANENLPFENKTNIYSNLDSNCIFSLPIRILNP